ncbi:MULTISPECIES: hypothetical protein [unclassified Duganella]|uniref:hypothetical protein n=1 Tax=unclassified Duganella TaxID=2636909 RepID=UPI000E342676|nr:MULTISPECIES: hypothetical protein [unclassified Duganella]RFP11930.1 hypothetical protein D0T23_18350 [Duganella sp. BJB475]RFP30060.1 hypothetical protein D0T21_19630 [Duganella sp. BJB476]
MASLKKTLLLASLLLAAFSVSALSPTQPPTRKLTGRLMSGGGIDDVSVSVLSRDNAPIDAYCDGQCGDWFEPARNGEGVTLRPALIGKKVELSVATERNGKRIAGPDENERLLFVKSSKLIK